MSSLLTLKCYLELNPNLRFLSQLLTVMKEKKERKEEVKEEIYDRMTKMAHFIPTTKKTIAERLARLFRDYV